MALDSAELIQYAREAASRGDDLYALLSVDATTPKEDIHRAWRRAGLKYHPDKAGTDYDPAKYESFERARDVLVDEAAREAYDNGLRAVLQKKRRMDEMSSKQRQFAEELEMREREAKRRKMGEGVEPNAGLSASQRESLERAREAGRRRLEERARQMKEAEERSRMKEASRQKGEGPGPGVGTAGVHTPRATTPTAAAPTAAMPPGQRVADPGTGHGEDTRSANQGTPPITLEDYDKREAELERKLRENREKRERKAAKKSRKSDVSGLFSSSSTRWSPPADPSQPLPDKTAEPKADGEKVPNAPERRAPTSSSFKPYAASAPTSPAGGKQGGSMPSFEKTMARLKAAQREKEERRRREADAVAAAAGEQQDA